MPNNDKLKVWVQPVGDFWNLKHDNTVQARLRNQEDALEEAKLYIERYLQKNPDTIAEIILETKEGLIKILPYEK